MHLKKAVNCCPCALRVTCHVIIQVHEISHMRLVISAVCSSERPARAHQTQAARRHNKAGKQYTGTANLMQRPKGIPNKNRVA